MNLHKIALIMVNGSDFTSLCTADCDKVWWSDEFSACFHINPTLFLKRAFLWVRVELNLISPSHIANYHVTTSSKGLLNAFQSKSYDCKNIFKASIEFFVRQLFSINFILFVGTLCVWKGFLEIRWKLAWGKYTKTWTISCYFIHFHTFYLHV